MYIVTLTHIYYRDKLITVYIVIFNTISYNKILYITKFNPNLEFYYSLVFLCRLPCRDKSRNISRLSRLPCLDKSCDKSRVLLLIFSLAAARLVLIWSLERLATSFAPLCLFTSSLVDDSICSTLFWSAATFFTPEVPGLLFSPRTSSSSDVSLGISMAEAAAAASRACND